MSFSSYNWVSTWRGVSQCLVLKVIFYFQDLYSINSAKKFFLCQLFSVLRYYETLIFRSVILHETASIFYDPEKKKLLIFFFFLKKRKHWEPNFLFFFSSMFSSLFNPFLNRLCFLRFCSTSLLKTLLEKKKLLVTSNFSFSRSVSYSFGELSDIFITLRIVVCKLFSLEETKICGLGKG